jgi:predicted transcriptional regulator
MSTTSVKLSDATKERIARLAAKQGTTSHALMVEAIESTLDSREKFELFLDAATRSRDEMVESGLAFDGDEFASYLRAKSRGESISRPSTTKVKRLVQGPK